MKFEVSLQNNVNTISEDKSELLNNDVVVDCAEKSSSKNDLLINSFLNVSSQEMEINTEIVKREYEAMRKTGWLVPYTKDPESFRSWINERCTSKIFILSIFSSIIPLFFNSYFKFDISYLLFAAIYICSSMIAWISLSGEFMNIGAKGLFKKFNINIKSKEKKDLVNIFSLFSIFLNNSVVDFTQEEKKEILEKVILFFYHSETEKIIKLLNDVIFSIDKEVYNFEKFGLINSKQTKQILNKEAAYRNIQTEILQCATHGNLLKSENKEVTEDVFKDDFVQGLVKQKIDQDKVDYFTDDFFKRFEKMSFFKISTLYSDFVLNFALVLTGFLMIGSFILLIKSFIIGLIALPLFSLPFILLMCLLKRGDRVFNLYDIPKDKTDINVLAKKTALLSLLLKSQGNCFTEKEQEEILNKYIDSVFSSSSFSFSEMLSKVETKRLEYLNNKENSSKEVENKNELCSLLNDEDNFQELSIEARKNILFNK